MAELKPIPNPPAPKQMVPDAAPTPNVPAQTLAPGTALPKVKVQVTPTTKTTQAITPAPQTVDWAPTVRLRWNGDVLEQEWILTGWKKGDTAETGEHNYEWRPVPDKAAK
jgi:hypothetical protein